MYQAEKYAFEISPFFSTKFSVINSTFLWLSCQNGEYYPMGPQIVTGDEKQ